MARWHNFLLSLPHRAFNLHVDNRHPRGIALFENAIITNMLRLPPMWHRYLFLICFHFLSVWGTISGVAQASPSTEFDYQLDAYYTAADFYVSLTSSPIPYYDNTRELDIYRKLLLSSPLPRFVLLEASVNPLPLTGVWIRRQAPALYRNSELSDNLNLVQAVTTGFEEPWAVSLFLGNIVNFKPARTTKYGEGKGHMGYLVSAGNYHIKDNDMLKDNWIETEWKVKGDRIKPDIKLVWSFRLGAKFHSREEVEDVFYVALKRSRTDYAQRAFSWYKNAGILYRFDVSQGNLRPIQHLLTVDRKFPRPGRKAVPAIVLGILLRTNDKYTGSLKEAGSEFRLIVQPNIEF